VLKEIGSLQKAVGKIQNICQLQIATANYQLKVSGHMNLTFYQTTFILIVLM